MAQQKAKLKSEVTQCQNLGPDKAGSRFAQLKVNQKSELVDLWHQFLAHVSWASCTA